MHEYMQMRMPHHDQDEWPLQIITFYPQVQRESQDNGMQMLHVIESSALELIASYKNRKEMKVWKNTMDAIRDHFIILDEELPNMYLAPKQ